VTSDTTDNKDDFHQGYRNRFLATPWAVFYRPALEHPKPRVLGSQTAMVTGPKGEEIHCDPYGRIKVQFHWDREGLADDKTSCWMRVSSSWAGDRYGAIAIPRIGMEVLVTFLEGDPDQPLVTGCLYHKENQVPYDLPANKTRTVFKTLSSPGGGGYNELRIEDKKGAEQIFIHAQRDWDENIEHDQKIRVGNERHDTVEKNTYTELKAEEHRTTIADRKTETRMDDHLTVGQNQHVKLGTAQLTSVGKEIHLKAGDKIVIEAGMELTVKAGGSFIKLDAGGITVVGPVIKINAGGSAGSGTGIGIKPPVLPGAADKDKAGSLMDQALLNAPSTQLKETSQKSFRIQMTRPYEKKGISSQPYVLEVDGVTYKGTTSAEGYIDQPVPPSAKKGKLTFYPFGSGALPWIWELDLSTQSEASDVKGLQSRLKNLGFYNGKIDGENGPKTKYATRCFHRSCELTDKDYLSASDIKRLQAQHIA
jgi:type VI secretion system secreted protein VgrG